MDLLPDFINTWLVQYGEFTLFFLLALGIIALPIPEETLLVFSGLFISQGTFSLIPTFLFAYFGSLTGITVSYLIGSTGGLYLIKKYGRYVGLSESKLLMAHNWFEHYGKWMLFIGYFVPGLRHFTGVFAGISTLEYSHFALFAYTGAFFWVATFLTVGYFFGNYYTHVFEIIESNLEITILVLLTLFIAIGTFYYYRKKKQ